MVIVSNVFFCIRYIYTCLQLLKLFSLFFSVLYISFLFLFVFVHSSQHSAKYTLNIIIKHKNSAGYAFSSCSRFWWIVLSLHHPLSSLILSTTSFFFAVFFCNSRSEKMEFITIICLPDIPFFFFLCPHFELTAVRAINCNAPRKNEEML